MPVTDSRRVARCPVGPVDNTGHYWVPTPPPGPHLWEQDKTLFDWQRNETACRLRVEDGADLLRELAGKRIAFLGDSTTRLLAYEAVLWGWGCPIVWDIVPQPPTAWPERLQGVTLASSTYPDGLRYENRDSSG